MFNHLDQICGINVWLLIESSSWQPRISGFSVENVYSKAFDNFEPKGTCYLQFEIKNMLHAPKL